MFCCKEHAILHKLRLQATSNRSTPCLQPTPTMFQNTLSEYWSSFCDKVIDWRTTRNLTTLNPNRPLEHLSIIIGCFHLLLYTLRLFDGLIARLILLTLSVTPSKIRQTISPTIKQNCTGSNVWQWTLVISINWDECIIIVMQNRYKYSSPCTTYCTETRQKMDFYPICLWQNGLMPQKVNWRKIFNAFSTIWKPDLNGRLLPHFHDAVFVGRD